MARYDDRRMGDRSIEEACNEGDRDLLQDYVGDERGDMVTHFNKSHMHMSMYFNRNPPADSAFARDKPFNPMRFAEVTGVEKPLTHIPADFHDECIIERIDGWQYHPEFQSETDIRRVFRLADQGLELDIDETLHYMCATAKAERVKPLLEWENSFDNHPNQVILQRMYDNIEQKLPMFEGIGMMSSKYKPK